MVIDGSSSIMKNQFISVDDNPDDFMFWMVLVAYGIYGYKNERWFFNELKPFK